MAQGFQDRQEGALSGPGNPVEHFARSLAGRVERDHGLVLVKAARAVEPVPVADGIQRMEEAGIVDPGILRFEQLGAPVNHVERPQRQWIEGKARCVHRQGRPGLGLMRIQPATRRPIAAGKHALTQPVSTRRAINPGHRVFVVGRPGFSDVEEGVDIAQGLDMLVDTGRADGNQLELHIQDQAGQAETADGGGKQVRFCVRAHVQHTPV